MIGRLIVLAGLALAASASAQAPAPGSAPDPAELFGVRESVAQIDISPDGRHVVYLQPGAGRTTIVYISDLTSDAEPRVVVRSSGNPERFRWCDFVTNDRLICGVSGMAMVEGTLVPFSRLVSIDTNGQNLKLLGQTSSFYDAHLRQDSGAIVDWLPGQNGQVLMARNYVPEERTNGTRMQRTADGLAIDRIDVRTLESTRVEQLDRNVGWYLTDGRGTVRIRAVPQVHGDNHELTGQTEFFYRTAGSRDWHPFSIAGDPAHESVTPVAVDAATDSAYVLKKLGGRMALYRVKLDGSMTTELVYANEHVDVDDVVWASHGSRVIGVTFVEEERRIVYFDPTYAALARSLGPSIPSLPLIDFAGASADGNQILVHAGADNDAGRYYVFDRTHQSLNEILMVRPQLENVTLASVRAITYPAAAGTQIPAYLTLPPGSTGRNLPTVVLPHGGPQSRDEWGFDWLAQYLAHLGYAVLQPNYRGSGGYGDQWLRQNGFTGWRTSIGDITAGARWLAAQGISDANRTAILGWSYGGYAALQAGATEPRLFKAIVAIAPVTDLQQAKTDAESYTDTRNVAELIGSGPHIVEGSPLRQVATIGAPVLLFHGDRDINVNLIHSQRMDQALRGAGKSSELTVFPGLEHDLDDTSARVQMLRRIGAFLQAHIGH
jgi:dienelactone hydrolase